MYKVNLLDDLIFADKKQVYFLIDLNVLPNICHVISGDLAQIGLPKFETIEAKKLLEFVEPDNLLAEVEGKHTFIEKIRQNFLTFKEELFLYIPIKNNQSPLWLYIRLRRLSEKNLIIGQVVRVYEDTPISIIHYQKTYQDPLTRLFNRETLKMHMSYLQNTAGSYLMYLDIDGFKHINDLHGHQVGDKFLVEIAEHFISKWEYNVLYYRLGGDEFAVYCYDHDDTTIIKRAQQIINEIETLNDTAKSLKVSVSIGIIKITDWNKDYHNLLNLGDKAMYESKGKGKGKFTLYAY